MTDYQKFIAAKAIVDKPSGFEAKTLPEWMFEFQRDCVKWAIARGKAALFHDCGLGKTNQEQVWGQNVVEHTNKPVLILTPLCVASQHVREAAKFGMEVIYARNQSEVTKPALYVTNYQKLHLFESDKFAGLAADESSCLKSLDGSTRTEVIEFAKRIPYRLAGTATPSPNDYMELGNHAEFLGVMRYSEMLSTFFVHDGGETQKWRLKRHAQQAFWKWVASWAVNIRKPSDLGYEDGRFTLPPLHMHEHIIESNATMDGFLFPLPASTLDERRAARRASLNERVEKTAELILASGEQWVAWGDLNDECKQLAKLIVAEEICGDTPDEERERITEAFRAGQIKRVVTKPSLWGFGLNLQNCCNTALIGMSDSYERFYQLIRRFWRFGQLNPVNVHMFISSAEGAVLRNVKRKDADAQRMADEMVKHMADFSRKEIRQSSRAAETYNPKITMEIPDWLRSEAA